mmetsp:Transcript_11870/g.14880  ORF Transcript_11870/g.14880 Transcript_11870/m.14880 type:complete len:438 (-) Transcript_11870:24-1337(-)
MFVWVNLFGMFSLYFGYNIDCKNGCSGTQKCKNNEDCHIICNTSNACKDTTFICSNDNNCYIDCISNDNNDSPCLGTIFDGEYAKSININVNTNNYNNVWSFGTVKCPINGDCNINCNGIYTNGGHIGGVCQHNTIYGLNSNSVNIYGFGNYPLWDFNIYCPIVKNGICNIIVNNGTGLMDDVAIYSKYGFKSVNIFCENSYPNKCHTKAHLPILICENSQCSIKSYNNNQWICSDLTNKCNKDPLISTKVSNTNINRDISSTKEVTVFKHYNIEMMQTHIAFWVLLVTLICLLIICCIVTTMIVRKLHDSLTIDALDSIPKGITNNISDDISASDSITATKTFDDINNNNIIKFSPEYKNYAVVYSQNQMKDIIQPKISCNNINDINDDIITEPSVNNIRGEYSIFISSTHTDSSLPSIPNLPIERHINIPVKHQQ